MHHRKFSIKVSRLFLYFTTIFEFAETSKKSLVVSCIECMNFYTKLQTAGTLFSFTVHRQWLKIFNRVLNPYVQVIWIKLSHSSLDSYRFQKYLEYVFTHLEGRD